MTSTVIEARGRDSAAVAVVEGPAPVISWGAVIGGAFIIAAVSVILLALGAGFGLSSVSPWPRAGVSLTTFTVEMAVWLIIVQWLSAALGGYVAGRACVPSPRLHVHAGYFRDTTHGILAWAVASVATAVLLASAVTALIGGPATGAAQGAAQNASGGSTGYFVDSLYRSDKPGTNASAQDTRAESTRILATDLRLKDVPAADKTYLAHLVAAHTGLSQQEAQKRVDETIAKARQAADDARKAAMRLALFTGFSMLIGAFIGGVAAKIGGHHRDQVATL